MTGYASHASTFKVVRQRIQSFQLFGLTWLTFQQIDVMKNQMELSLTEDRTTLLYLGKPLVVFVQEIREVS